MKQFFYVKNNDYLSFLFVQKNLFLNQFKVKFLSKLVYTMVFSNIKSRLLYCIFFILILFGIVFMIYFEITLEVISNLQLGSNFTGRLKNFADKFNKKQVLFDNYQPITDQVLVISTKSVVKIKQSTEQINTEKKTYNGFNTNTLSETVKLQSKQNQNKYATTEKVKNFTTLIVLLDHSNKTFIPADCSLWEIPSNWKSENNPLIKLNPERFLYPGLMYGPNNQITGFKETIYLAIRLNRLVLNCCCYQKTKCKMLFCFQFQDVSSSIFSISLYKQRKAIISVSNNRR